MGSRRCCLYRSLPLLPTAAAARQLQPLSISLPLCPPQSRSPAHTTPSPAQPRSQFLRARHAAARHPVEFHSGQSTLSHTHLPGGRTSERGREGERERGRDASVASSAGRRFPSDSGAFADWVGASAAGGGGLSLGFNAAAPAGAGLWAPAAALNFGIAAGGDVGMVLVAPAASYHHHRGAATGETVFPLLAGGQCALDADTSSKTSGAAAAATGSAIRFWQSQPTTGVGSADKKPLPMLDYSGGSGAATCHDCGNQAKKDCNHHRCRTCCKSRGFDCPTHVKSTWVPAARRRERQQLAAALSPPTASAFPATTASAKKPRLLCSQTTTATTSRTSTSNANASFRDALPRHVRAPAVFRCVRVTSVEDGGDDGFAYQASVSINGHTFRGFLYDHSADDGRGLASTSNDDSTHAGAGVPSISDLHLGSSSAVPAHLYSGGSVPLILGGLGYDNVMN
ncbi:hypothetical protein GUJ93_ZPchr0010g11292 [Zizania palustris]|uniref:Uncharacterized protein n=1 Tax=Zizania palustris TaxID=103762 RepID=A0A8J6BHQ1_ZIZPA|nr:hypothetical protein GUJ93_ZPchr0010g11292 [Zizania palustris]